jgi:hypothetical protein
VLNSLRSRRWDDAARSFFPRAALIAAAALISILSGFAQPASPASGYDSSWYISEFWSGEYPKGFSVTRPDTVVQARRSMDKAAPREVACKLPYLAVIHPWNKRRIAQSEVRFWSATKIVHLIVKEPFLFEDFSRDGRGKVRLEKGDVIDYIRNDAEGSFEVRIAGKEHTAGQDLFDHVQDVPADQFVEDDWAALTCVGGNRAYIFLDDLGLGSDDRKEQVAGISEPGPGQTGYGHARDLTAAEARALEVERSKNNARPR